jgi:hypothetical protein
MIINMVNSVFLCHLDKAAQSLAKVFVTNAATISTVQFTYACKRKYGPVRMAAAVTMTLR